jgi:hypothetical protein
MFSNIHSPQESGQNLAWLATSTDTKAVSGEYYEGRKRIKSSVESYDERKQDEPGSAEIPKFPVSIRIDARIVRYR